MPPVNETMDTPAKEVEIPVPWGVIKGKWWGSQVKRPLLAVHGWQDNAGSFDTLAPLLLPETSVLSIDLPGHGLSTHIPKGMMYYLFWDALIVIRRIVLYYKWDKVSLIGHSLGGAAGFLYAAVYPDQVDKLIEIDICPPRVAKPEALLKQTGDCIDRFLKLEKLDGKGAPCYEYDEMVNTALEGHKGSLTKESIEVLLRRGMLPDENDPSKYKFTRDVRLKTAGLAMFSREEVLVYASKIKCDYMNIRGEPGMTFEIPELYQECLDKIKISARRFESHTIPGTHHLHLNNPNDIAGLISKFLAQGDTNNVNNSIEHDEDYPV